jgi:hypothetical protein
MNRNRTKRLEVHGIIKRVKKNDKKTRCYLNDKKRNDQKGIKDDAEKFNLQIPPSKRMEII